MNEPRAHGGRFVELAEMVLFAKPGRAACRGNGYMVRFVSGQRTPWPCVCAIKRFMRVHAAHVYDNAGRLFWHTEHVPAGAVVVAAPEAQLETVPAA